MARGRKGSPPDQLGIATTAAPDGPDLPIL
jgi:hypothetical protein